MFNLSNLLASLVGIAIAISIHEFGHAYSAHLLGDDTAKYNGRMTKPCQTCGSFRVNNVNIMPFWMGKASSS